MKHAGTSNRPGAPKRVLFIASSPNLLGGAEHCLVDIVRHMGATGWEPFVVVPGEGSLAETLRRDDIPTFVVDLGVLRHRGEARSPKLALRLAVAAGASRRIASIIRTHDIAVVHTNASTVIAGALAARRTRVAHVWHVRELLHGRPWRVLRRAMYRYSSVILCISRCVADHVEEGGHGHAAVEVLSDGIDLSQFSPSDATVASNTVVMLSRIHPEKGHEVFIRAAAMVAGRVPNTRFAMIGGCLPVYQPLRQHFESLIDELGVAGRVELRSDVSRSDAAAAIRDADVVVVPSQWVEPGGLVVLEAMACAKPVVAPDRGGPAEVIESGVDGFLVRYDDAATYAETVERLLADPELRASVGHAARERVARGFDVDDQVQRLGELYDRLAPERVAECA